jgi:transposase
VFANSRDLGTRWCLSRGALTNEQWARLEPWRPPRKPKTGRPAADHRRSINGIRWITRTGAPWRELPDRYAPWQTVASRFYRWQRAGVGQRMLAARQQQADAAGDLAWNIHSVDAPVVRAHQPAAGANKGALRTTR